MNIFEQLRALVDPYQSHFVVRNGDCLLVDEDKVRRQVDEVMEMAVLSGGPLDTSTPFFGEQTDDVMDVCGLDVLRQMTTHMPNGLAVDPDHPGAPSAMATLEGLEFEANGHTAALAVNALAEAFNRR